MGSRGPCRGGVCTRGSGCRRWRRPRRPRRLQRRPTAEAAAAADHPPHAADAMTDIEPRLQAEENRPIAYAISQLHHFPFSSIFPFLLHVKSSERLKTVVAAEI